MLGLCVALFAAACSSSGESAADGDGPGSGGGAFGASCVDNADCQSGVCAFAGGLAYCSSPCSREEDCTSIMSGACCDVLNRNCLLPEQCEATTDGDAPADGDDSTLCYPEQMRCHGSDLERCNANGDWEFYRDCAADGKVCADNACSDGADGDGTDGDSPDGDGGGCENGGMRCAGNTIQFCNDRGTWEILKDCEAPQICLNGQCTLPLGPECTKADGCEGDLEYCLPDRAGGEEGHCATFCDQVGVVCPRGWQCEHAECQPIDGYCRTDADCPLDEFCDKLPGAADGICAPYCDRQGQNCPELYRCVTDNRDPNYGRCILENPTCQECAYDGQCGSGSYCEIVTGQTKGCCRPQCGPANPCPGALVCNVDGRCVVGTGQGDCGGQCPPGHVCDPTFNVCVLNCPACGENQCCDSTSAPNCYPCSCTNPVICGVLLQPCCFGYNCSAVVYGVIGYCI